MIDKNWETKHAALAARIRSITAQLKADRLASAVRSLAQHGTPPLGMRCRPSSSEEQEAEARREESEYSHSDEAHQ